MPRFRLGDGVNSVTMEQAGSGQNVFGLGKGERKPKPHSKIKYDVKLVETTNEIKKQLAMAMGVQLKTEPFAMKLQASLSKAMSSNKTDIYLVVHVETITSVSLLDAPKLLDVEKFCTDIKHLEGDSALEYFHFLYGDSYIREIQYGKSLHAVLKLSTDRREQAMLFRESFSAHLNSLTQGIGLQQALETRNTHLDDSLISEIHLDARGSSLPAPQVIRNVGVLLDYIASFNASEHDTPIPLHTEVVPYAQALTDPAVRKSEGHFVDLQKRVELVKPLYETACALLDELELNEQRIQHIYQKNMETVGDGEQLEAVRNDINCLKKSLSEIKRTCGRPFSQGRAEFSVMACRLERYRQDLSNVSEVLIDMGKYGEVITKTYSRQNPREDKKHGISSQKIMINPRGISSNLVFWQVDPKHPDASKIHFDIYYKDGGKLASYKILERDISGCLSMNTATLKEGRKFYIAHPQGTDKPFDVLISANNPLQQQVKKPRLTRGGSLIANAQRGMSIFSAGSAIPDSDNKSMIAAPTV